MIFLRSFFLVPGRGLGCVVSMRPRRLPQVPELTARMARAAFPKGTLAIRMRDELGELYGDAEFVSAFGVRGRSGISPGQLAMVTVLQFTEDLTDRQAAEAVRGRIDWKYCLGLALDDSGFDFSVLSEFRTRLVEHGLEELVLDALLVRLGELGLVTAGGKQRTDSTHVISAIRDLNRGGAGRGVGTGVCGGAGGRGPRLAHPGHRRARLEPALRAPGRFLAAAHLTDQAHGAGQCLWHRRGGIAARH